MRFKRSGDHEVEELGVFLFYFLFSGSVLRGCWYLRFLRRAGGSGGFFCGLVCGLELEWGEFLVKSDGDCWCVVGDGLKGAPILFVYAVDSLSPQSSQLIHQHLHLKL